MKMILFVFFTISMAVYAAPQQEVVATPAKKADAPVFPECEVAAAKRCLDKCKAHCNNGVGNGPDCRPGRARFDNDDRGGVPGAPGAKGGGELGTEYVTKNKGDNDVVNTDLVFQGDLAGSWKRTACQDKCEDDEFAACKEPAKEPAKEPVVVAYQAPPAAPATCQLTPRGVDECTAEANKAEKCNNCVTTKCKTCRTVYIDLCTKPQRRASLESCLKLSEGAADKAKTRNAIAALCAEQTCAEPEKPVVVDIKPEEPKPVVYAPVAQEPKVEVPKVEVPKVEVVAGNDAKVIIPPPVPAGTCTPTKARQLKIRGTGRACDDAKALREQIKKLKEQVNCILSAFEGKIPTVVDVIKAPVVVEKVEKAVRADTTVDNKREEAKVFVEKIAEAAKPAYNPAPAVEVAKPARAASRGKSAPKPAGYTAPVRAASRGKSVNVVKTATQYGGGAVKAIKVVKRGGSRGGSRRRRNGRAGSRGGSRGGRRRNGRAGSRGGSRGGRRRNGRARSAKRGGSRGGSRNGRARSAKRGGSRGGSRNGRARSTKQRGGGYTAPAPKAAPAPKPAAY